MIYIINCADHHATFQPHSVTATQHQLVKTGILVDISTECEKEKGEENRGPTSQGSNVSYPSVDLGDRQQALLLRSDTQEAGLVPPAHVSDSSMNLVDLTHSQGMHDGVGSLDSSPQQSQELF